MMPLQLAWPQPFAPSTKSEKLTCAPVLAGNVLVFATHDDMEKDFLYGVSLYDGSLRWKHKISHPISEIFTANGTVFFKGHTSDFYIDPLGERAKNEPGDVPNACDVDPHPQDIAVTTLGVVALDVGSGRLKSDWYHVAKVEGRILVLEGNVLVMLEDRTISAYDVITGKLIWSWAAQFLYFIPDGRPSHGDGAIYFTIRATVQAINIRSGALRWKHQRQEVGKHNPLFADGMVVVQESDKLEFLDSKTGKRIWEASASTDIAPVVCPEGGFLVCSLSPNIVAIRCLRTGDLLQSMTLQEMVKTSTLKNDKKYESGSFLTSVINGPASPLISGFDGRKLYEAHIVLATKEGAVFNYHLHVDMSNLNAAFKDRVRKFALDSSIGLSSRPREYVPVAGDGTVVFTADDNKLWAHNLIGDNYAPRFENLNSSNLTDGRSQQPNYIKLPSNARFDFGQSDFSLELWTKTTHGGELLTQSADPGSNGAGFRLSIVNTAGGIRCGDFGEGRVQLAITEADPDRGIALVASTDPTTLTDGKWHHLTVTRKQNQITVFVDGLSQPTAVVIHRDFFPKSVQDLHHGDELFLSPSLVDVTAKVPAVGNKKQPLVVGAYVAANKVLEDQYSPNYDGLIADVRVWDHGLYAAEISDRNTKSLTGLEHGLIGYWPLLSQKNENQKSGYQDLAGGGKDKPRAIPEGNVVGVKKQQTYLRLGEERFPHLLRPETVQWPYHERWAVGGVEAPGWDATVGQLMSASSHTLAVSGETLAFFAGDHLHAVDLIHGDRLWSLTMPEGTSLVADQDTVYMRHLAPKKQNERGQSEVVRALDSKTGAQKWEYKLSDEDITIDGETGKLTRTALVSVGPLICIETLQTLWWVSKETGVQVGSTDCLWGATSMHAGDLGLYFGTSEGKLKFVPMIRGENGLTRPGLDAENVTVDVGGSGSITTADGVLFVDNGQTIVRLDARTLEPSKNLARADNGKIVTHDHIWQPPSRSKGRIIGMAASPSHNRLVLTTEFNGEVTVEFLEFASGKRIRSVRPPQGLNAVISAPVVDGDYVFLTIGGMNIFYGTDDGAALAYDLRTGTLRGNDSLKTQPHGRPIMAQGALYFACHSGDSEQARPEANAVHSVVFGNEYALKLSGEQNSVITMKDTEKLLDPDDSGPDGHGLSSGNFTLETWVNTSGKGGQLIYSPGLKRKNGDGGFSLTVTPEGDVVAAFSNHAQRHSFTAKGTAAADGSWHHLAAVFRQEQNKLAPFCELYVDGRRLDSAAANSAVNISHLDTDVRNVYIGGTRGQKFQGMLADVRIWGTWLHAEEIASRRSVRLRGDEPDLLANWSFDDGTVHDHSVNDFHNESAGALDVWLTDLHFTAPHYPYLSATSAPAGPPTRKQNADGTFTIAEAVYTTTITARTADGSGRPNTLITIMTNEQVTISGPSIKRETLERLKERTVVTDAKGNLKLTLTCNDLIHSPELKLRADFMYTNEWFHVSPAIQNQTMVTLPPPKLTAHCDMIEELHYDNGDTLGEYKAGVDPRENLHEHAQITTLKTTIVATGSNGGPMPFEPIEVWADDHVDIEVDGITYSVNADNSAKFKTGANGELLVTLHENANKGPGGNLLNVPNLVVRAGFMPRSSNFVIHPAEYSLSALENVTAKQLTGEEALPHAENKKSVLLKGDNAKNAEEVAKTLQHMMALTKKARPAGVQAAGMARGKRLTSEATHLNQQFASADSVQSLHHHAHVDIHRPVSPDHMPAPHFAMALNKNGRMEYMAFHKAKDLDRYLVLNRLGTANTLFASASRFGPDDAAGGWGWFSSVAKAFKKVAVGISHAVQEVAQVVVRTVQVVVEATKEIVSRVELAIVSAAGAIGTWVINTVKDVADHVVAFIEKIGSAIKDVYNFVKSLFNWKQILEVHDVLKDTISKRLEGIKQHLKKAVPDAITSMADKAKAAVDKVLGMETSHESLNSLAQTPNEQSSKVVSHTKSNKGKHMQEKVEYNSKKATGVLAIAAPDDKTIQHDIGLLDRAKKIGEDLMQVVKSVASPGDMTLDPFKHLLRDLADFAIEVMKDLGLKFVEALDSVFELVVKGLKAEIHIPFVSALYKTLTGNALSLLDVTCLVLAVPVNLVLVMTGTKWNKSEVQLGAEAVFAMAEGRHRDAAGAPNGRYTAQAFSVIWAVVMVVWMTVKASSDAAGGVAEGAAQAAMEAATAATFGLAAAPVVAMTLFAPDPLVAILGGIEFGVALIAQICQTIYRAAIDQKWNLVGDLVSWDNLGGALSVIAAIGVVGSAISAVQKGVSSILGDISKAVCCAVAGLAIILTLVGVGSIDNSADWAEFGISLGAGSLAILGILGLDRLPQPAPALALAALDFIAVPTMVAIHYALGHGNKAFHGDPEPAVG